MFECDVSRWTLENEEKQREEASRDRKTTDRCPSVIFLILVIGIPASGKSTWLHHVKQVFHSSLHVKDDSNSSVSAPVLTAASQGEEGLLLQKNVNEETTTHASPTSSSSRDTSTERLFRIRSIDVFALDDYMSTLQSDKEAYAKGATKNEGRGTHEKHGKAHTPTNESEDGNQNDYNGEGNLSTGIFSPQLWKLASEKLFDDVQEFLKARVRENHHHLSSLGCPQEANQALGDADSAHGGGGGEVTTVTHDARLVFVEDNMHYRSMRERYWKVCRKLYAQQQQQYQQEHIITMPPPTTTTATTMKTVEPSPLLAVLDGDDFHPRRATPRSAAASPPVFMMEIIMDAPLEECLRRNATRSKNMGSMVMGMPVVDSAPAPGQMAGSPPSVSAIVSSPSPSPQSLLPLPSIPEALIRQMYERFEHGSGGGATVTTSPPPSPLEQRRRLSGSGSYEWLFYTKCDWIGIRYLQTSSPPTAAFPLSSCVNVSSFCATQRHDLSCSPPAHNTEPCEDSSAPRTRHPTTSGLVSSTLHPGGESPRKTVHSLEETVQLCAAEFLSFFSEGSRERNILYPKMKAQAQRLYHLWCCAEKEKVQQSVVAERRQRREQRRQQRLAQTGEASQRGSLSQSLTHHSMLESKGLVKSTSGEAIGSSATTSVTNSFSALDVAASAAAVAVASAVEKYRAAYPTNNVHLDGVSQLPATATEDVSSVVPPSPGALSPVHILDQHLRLLTREVIQDYLKKRSQQACSCASEGKSHIIASPTARGNLNSKGGKGHAPHTRDSSSPVFISPEENHRDTNSNSNDDVVKAFQRHAQQLKREYLQKFRDTALGKQRQACYSSPSSLSDDPTLAEVARACKVDMDEQTQILSAIDLLGVQRSDVENWVRNEIIDPFCQCLLAFLAR